MHFRMNTDTQVLDPAVAEPMVIDPNTATPAPTETLDPAVSTPIDPITGSNSNPGSSSNTSNGNQVAVNSSFDYSVHSYTVYSYSSTQNQETLNAQVIPANSNSQLSESFSCGTSEARLGRSYRFASRQFFSGRRSRVERITNFDAEAGDTMELSRRLFKGIGELDFVTVATRKGSQRAARTDNDIIYEQSTGRLYFNANSGDQGFGNKGGLFAVLDSSPLISESQFVIF
jgi:hypothetical protein